MAEKFSLKDHLFNEQTVGQLAAEYAAGIAGFDAERFIREALAGFPERELMARMEWIADCLEGQLAPDFATMADQLLAALSERLDETKKDDDFGHFIHAIPGILAVRHGLETDRSRAMGLLYEATQRFSMEFYIRAFINRWPEETMAELAVWATDSNYHVRRLVSEGTRPRLPWATNIILTPEQSMPLLDSLHADPTRFVTRSVANHLNDLSKIVPDAVLELLAKWFREGRQSEKELVWMRRHALRTLIKQGHAGAMTALGYRTDAPVKAQIILGQPEVKIGDALTFEVILNNDEDLPVLIDYRIDFMRAGGKRAEKVFKLKSSDLRAGKVLKIKKSHRFKGDATTFTLYEGPHRIIAQVNGRDVAEVGFELTS